MDGVRLWLLGGFELRLDGALLGLQPSMQRLVTLVALTTRGVSRQHAAFQLWPDTDEQRARANLRSTLWRLHKLPAKVVTATEERLHLADDVWVDTRDGMAELAAGDSDVLGPDLPFQALDADLLPDWYDDWLVIERERLRQLRLRLLEERGRAALLAGDTGTAIQSGLAAVAIDPLRETSHRLVIEAHLVEGNAREALRQLDHFRSCAAGADGCPPSPVLESLVPQVVLTV
jgi:DNA-binding SARP family transcriptional activator